MGRRPKVARSSETLPPMRPALTPEAREGQMISLAVDLVEQRLRDGTATSQETTHYLKLASQRERLNMKKMEKEIEMMDAKIQSLQTRDDLKDLLDEALSAFKRYSGYDDESDY